MNLYPTLTRQHTSFCCKVIAHAPEPSKRLTTRSRVVASGVDILQLQYIKSGRTTNPELQRVSFAYKSTVPVDTTPCQPPVSVSRGGCMSRGNSGSGRHAGSGRPAAAATTAAAAADTAGISERMPYGGSVLCSGGAVAAAAAAAKGGG